MAEDPRKMTFVNEDSGKVITVNNTSFEHPDDLNEDELYNSHLDYYGNEEYSDYDDGWDELDRPYDDEEWDEHWSYEWPPEYCTEVCEKSYVGDLLISEIIKQGNRMYCLASNFLLIADIDCGCDTEKAIALLTNFVAKNGGTFRVYRTRNGLRYLQTDCAYHGVNRCAIETLKALESDPQYIDMCEQGGHFMARLTPKLDPSSVEDYYQKVRFEGSPKCGVCTYIKTVGCDLESKMLSESIKTHDYICQSDRPELELK